MNKEFRNYADAYALYSDITAGRDPDRKNATITYVRYDTRSYFIVWWEPKQPLLD